MDVNELLFLGTHGHVAALQKSTGNLVWKTSLPSTGYSVVALIVEDGRLFCASGGRAFKAHGAGVFNLCAFHRMPGDQFVRLVFDNLCVPFHGRSGGRFHRPVRTVVVRHLH